MIVIHYPTAYKALDCFIDAFNEAAKKSTDKLRTGTVMTAKELIRIYGISLLKTNGYQEINENNLPTLQTNNRQLAKLVKCSSRTIQRHIAKLQLAGIVTSKVFHGSNSNFEVLINPKILLVRKQQPVHNLKKQFQEEIQQSSQNPLKSTFSELQKTNCPDTYTGNIYIKENNIIIEVDNSVNNKAGDLTGNRTGDTGEIAQVFSDKQKKNEEKNMQKTGEIALRADKLDDRNVLSDPARNNSLILYTNLLWLMARNLLYKEADLTEHQIEIAKDLIRKLYEPASTSNLPNVHQQYVERISLVSKYLKKDPVKRYVPLPYKYFDIHNPHGFVGTKKWYQADQLRKREVEKELALKRTIRKYQNNEKKDVSKKKPALQLFRECENTIGKFNDASLTQRFHAAVLEHETYRQLRTG
ncbi:MAG: hypothetical protein HY062_09230 [Bacteroidetes bacterium]|nr:hypothetical protein [Bacteroidota bacterium]